MPQKVTLNQSTLATPPTVLPIGYRWQYTSYGKEVAIEPQKAELIRQAFRLAATSGLSLRQVTKLIAASGLTGKQGEPISIASLWRILHTPFYAGLTPALVPGELVPSGFPAIVSEELWRAAKQAMGRV